jgi:site-specific DNA recombinase
MLAIAYARYSSSHQREESITAQLRAIHDYARRNGITIVREYTDEAESATTDDRPGFLQMINDVKNGKIKANLLLVHKLDRFARNRYDSAIYRKTLRKVGIKLIAVDQPLDEDRPESILLESLLEGLAEFYSKNLAREVMKGMKENAYQARFNGGTPPLGFDVINGYYAINEGEAQIIRLIYSTFRQCRNYRIILDRLNGQGYRTKAGRPFGKNSIYEILRNPRYAGYYVFNRAPTRVDGRRNWHARKKEEEIIMIPDAIPAIIPKEEWEEVQKILDSRKMKTAPRQRSEVIYILTGKAVCGECGGAMVGDSSRSKNGQVKRYYNCNRKLRTKECDNRQISKRILEDHVLKELERHFFAPGNKENLARNLVRLAQERDSKEAQEERELRKELADVESKIRSIVTAVENGADWKPFAERMKELSNRKEDLEGRLSSLTRPFKTITEDKVLKYLSSLKLSSLTSLNDVKKQELVVKYVHEVKVYRDREEIVLKFNVQVMDKSGAGELTILYPLPHNNNLGRRFFGSCSLSE